MQIKLHSSLQKFRYADVSSFRTIAKVNLSLCLALVVFRSVVRGSFVKFDNPGVDMSEEVM